MGKYPEIFVIRHGQTVWNKEGRHQGQLNSPLTVLGEQQAAGLSGVMRDLIDGRDVAAKVSTSGRARQTAELALGPLGLEAEPDARLMEVHFGEWQGLTKEEADLHWPGAMSPERHVFDWHFESPGGETYEDLRARVADFMDELTGPTVIVTHGITSRVIRGLWLGLDFEDMKEIGGGQGNVYHLISGVQRSIDGEI